MTLTFVTGKSRATELQIASFNFEKTELVLEY